MPAVNVRNLLKAIHRAVWLRAARYGCSNDAEIRAILDAAAHPVAGLGSRLGAIGRAFDGVELNIARDLAPLEPALFE